jgi:hypothetical protein
VNTSTYARLVARCRRADDVGLVRSRHQLVQADCCRNRALAVPARDAEDGPLVDPVPALVDPVELVDKPVLPRLEHERLACGRPLLVAEVLGEEVGDREQRGTNARAVAAIPHRLTRGLLLEVELARVTDRTYRNTSTWCDRLRRASAVVPASSESRNACLYAENAGASSLTRRA